MDGREDELEELAVRATIHLAGIKPGERRLVDPTDSYIADCLAAGYLVPLEGE